MIKLLNLKQKEHYGKNKIIVMHIFITGIAGFLGSNLSEYYLKKKYKVSGCDNLVGGDLSNLDLKKINFYKGDCENLEFMTKITKDVDVLCHTAAYAHEGLSSFSPTLICNNNVTGSTSVFTAAIRNKLKRIVFCSSMARYGNIKSPYHEDNKINPVDPYGVSKVAADVLVQEYGRYFGLKTGVFRGGCLTGPAHSGTQLHGFLAYLALALQRSRLNSKQQPNQILLSL